MSKITLLPNKSSQESVSRLPYDSDLTDGQWHLLQPHIQAAGPGSRPRSA